MAYAMTAKPLYRNQGFPHQCTLKSLFGLFYDDQTCKTDQKRFLSQLTSLRMFFKSTSQCLLNIYIREFQNNTIMVLNIFNMDSGHRLGLTGHFKPCKTFSSKSVKVDGSIDAKDSVSESESVCVSACVCL